jgi:hypothetical protein
MRREGTEWSVREVGCAHVPGARSDTSLLFESVDAIRRVWHYPHDWRSLDDAALWALCGAAAGPGMLPPPITVPHATVQRARELAARSADACRLAQVLMEEQQALRTACRERRETLRATVYRSTKALRDAGEPPDRAIVLVKTAVREATADQNAHAGEVDALVDSATQWCIEAYYAA